MMRSVLWFDSVTQPLSAFTHRNKTHTHTHTHKYSFTLSSTRLKILIWWKLNYVKRLHHHGWIKKILNAFWFFFFHEAHWASDKGSHGFFHRSKDVSWQQSRPFFLIHFSSGIICHNLYMLQGAWRWLQVGTQKQHRHCRAIRGVWGEMFKGERRCRAKSPGCSSGCICWQTLSPSWLYARIGWHTSTHMKYTPIHTQPISDTSDVCDYLC